MTDVDPAGLLLRLDPAALFAMFWFVLLFDVPRYTLAGLSVLVPALLRRHPPAAPALAPLVSVVLVGHNERHVVRRCVRSLREQTHRRLQIICVDDGSTDGMALELRRLKDEGQIDRALSTSLRGGKSGALNLGVSHAEGDIVLVTDCDCSFDRDAVAHLVAGFADPQVGAVTANIGARNPHASFLASVQAVEYLLSISLGKRFLDLFGQVTCASGALSAFRRQALLQVGGLDVGPGEDLDLTLRLRAAGWRVRFAEQAWCLTDVPTELRGFVRQRLRWERDALRLRLRKHRRHLDPRALGAPTSELLHQLEFVLTHVVLTLAFPVYVLWLVGVFGEAAITLLALVTLFYAALDGVGVLCALASAGRPGYGRLLPYALAYGPVHTYLLRAVRLVAYLQEWVFDASYRDDYVPARVARRAPRH